MKAQKPNKDLAKIKERLHEVSHLYAILRLMEWDQEVNMPPKGADARATATSYLSTIAHNKFVALDDDGLLSKLKKDFDQGKLKGDESVIVAEVWRDYSREKKIPAEFVKEASEVYAKSQTVWIEARKKNNFALWQPWLEKVVKLKQQEAKFVGYQTTAYDALLDSYEPGLTTTEATKVLSDLKDFLIPFLQEIKKSKLKIDLKRTWGKFPLDKQIAFNEFVAHKLGFDPEGGRLDKSVHPFSTNFHPSDIRMTTRYEEKDVLYSIGSTIHETGHSLYEQNLPAEHFGTPLAEAISLGIHESQSRLWENNIGKSLSFWQYFYPRLQKEFPTPFKKLPLPEFYQIINKVTPSLIRTEADEMTYNLHIILRFELERDLINGKIKVKDLPKLWANKMQGYLGIKVPKDSLGVLQDVHWSAGLIGYFPTYSLGNLYAAQFFAKMKKDLPNLEQKIKQGDFSTINNWLKKNIHQHGKTYRAQDLVKKVTGQDLDSHFFTDYLTQKYRSIYSIK